MTQMPPSKIKTIITEMINEDPAKNSSVISRELGIPELTVIQCFPEDMANLILPEHFDEITTEVAEWGELTLILQNDSVIFEVKSALPRGSYAKGYYNILGHKAPAGGHFRIDHLKEIAFVDKPFMGMRTLSIQFFNLSGDAMFKVFLGRDEKRNLLETQVEKYMALKAKLI